MVKITDPNNQDFRMSQVADRLKFVIPTPVILLAGAMTQRQLAGKNMAGIARAAFNTGSVVVDSGVGSQIEKFTMRKGVKLIGVCPEAQICYPRISNRQDNELTNGHTHFFMIGNADSGTEFEWGDESRCKYELV